MKICRDCKVEKEEIFFVKNKLFSSGIDTLCLECNRKRVKIYRKINKIPRSSKRKQVSASYRDIIIDALIKRDGFCCGFCNKSLENSKINIDHIIPVALGGMDILENVRLAHASCNQSFSNKIRKEKYGW